MSNPERAPEPEDRLLSFAVVASLVLLSKVHIRRLAARGDFPRPLKLSERRIGFRESEIRSWLASHHRARTAKEDAA